MKLSPVFEMLSYLLITAIMARATQITPDMTPQVLFSSKLFGTVLTNARTDAGRHDGETIGYVVKNGVTLLTIYAGLPTSGSVAVKLYPVYLQTTLKINGVTTGAILIDPDGTIRFDNGWTSWTTLVAMPAACTTSVTVQSTALPALALTAPSCSATE